MAHVSVKKSNNLRSVFAKSRVAVLWLTFSLDSRYQY